MGIKILSNIDFIKSLKPDQWVSTPNGPGTFSGRYEDWRKPWPEGEERPLRIPIAHHFGSNEELINTEFVCKEYQITFYTGGTQTMFAYPAELIKPLEPKP